ncbi:MAG: DUF5689 domain-containing protein [Candidatus Sumerlaeia bacterium]|nr:DUF5689 domain-containing protein [Candidatus Sumerlaeia bacterium]
MRGVIRTVAMVSCVLAIALSAARGENIWDLQAVNAQGLGTHPKVGADPGADPASSPNRVTIEGIALNAPDELLNPNSAWQVYVQAEPPDQGGIAAWAGTFYNPTWPRYPFDIYPGDRIRINGFVMNARGKVNINERHSALPGMQFVVTKLASDVGMPDPIVIPNLAACNSFDMTRATGGERYQAQWVRINNVQIQSGTWGPNQSLVVRDTAGSTLTMLLSERGDFARYPAPSGSFNVQGIFDQEDLASPFTDSYRLWVKRYSDIAIPSGILDSIWELQAVNAQGLGTHPKVGADPGADPATSPNRVKIVGIALNRPDELLNPANAWQVYVQAEWPQKGGIAAWAGTFYNPTWPRYPADINPGDLVMIDGFVMNARGKVNINERHSALPGMQFVVTKLASNVGMPRPQIITSLSQCNQFNASRTTGGERYQAQWVTLQNIRYVSGQWQAGQSVVVADDAGATITLLLSERGDFSGQSAPSGRFSATGIFDQEDLASPFTDSYRLWVKSKDDILLESADAKRWNLYR